MKLFSYLFIISLAMPCISLAGGVFAENVDFETLIRDPSRFDGKLIRLKGIYSGYYEPLIFENEEAFQDFKNQRAVLIVSNDEDLPREESRLPKHGAPVVVSGVFRVTPEENVQLFLGEISELTEYYRIDDESHPPQGGHLRKRRAQK